ncbi:hypothetical protein ACTFIT_003697 [Dictyostelium discoideum]
MFKIYHILLILIASSSLLFLQFQFIHCETNNQSPAIEQITMMNCSLVKCEKINCKQFEVEIKKSNSCCPTCINCSPYKCPNSCPKNYILVKNDNQCCPVCQHI